VAAGTVVRSQEVKPWVMVAGNPAKVIARFVDGTWQYLSDQWEVLA
jgi:acetyltransferase-like isoleucine patch superfamily enzyme